MFNYPEALRSHKCCGILVMLGRLLRLDISRIECRHEVLRKLVRKSLTWKPVLAEVSAYFVFRRHQLEGLNRSDLLKEMFDMFGFVDCRNAESKRSRLSAKNKAQGAAALKRKKESRYVVSADGSCRIAVPKRRDGGGAYKAALAMQLEGRQFASKADRQYKQ